ncbi:replicative DNA helicase [Alkalithermobacter thermoalcaliphilus JW-YL-7 = DSM 7308]|uniref:Replicative DNA helicase n=1 Tax=Alkalithermobacter thermoalcaliphilus JW-YL-7 = DSM 7308 TaxID=1121328 RepID=A0A150FU85_CLOPD|nr:replicative DNA helicase [[Clostridium] paradoxum JW-YL-7 = DSM 7308]SHL09498.1 replicative DNA helicase [[Clostridium] paradoxum JW-YL-7 = DSM 7308]
MEDKGKIPPHSVDAEQSVLGAILLDKDAMVLVSEVIVSDDFYKDAHKEIYDAMLYLYSKSEPIDLITLTEELKRRNTLDIVGGISYITSLSTIVPTSSNVKYYVDIVKEKSILRKLIKSSQEILELGYSESENIESILEKAEKSVFSISQEKTSDNLKPINEVLMDTYDMLEELYKNKGKITGITTGFTDLDRKTNGLQRTDLILIAARPAMGKTAFSLNVAQNAALKGNASVAIFSLEMSKEQLIQRILSAQANIELNKIKNGTLNEQEWPKLIEAMGVLSKLNIYIDDTPGITIRELRSKCRKLKIEKGLDLVLIDYLQLMEGDSKSESRQQEISKISRSLKILAKELDCPVIALSQLSRAPELRSDHRPILSDLRESGAIEQDADIVMFLYRDEYYHPDSEKKNIGEVIIAKHRHGETGTVELVWFGEFQKFHNLAKDINQT